MPPTESMKPGLLRLLAFAIVALLASKLQVCGAESPPAILFISPHQVVNITGSATLNCTVQADGQQVMWQRRDRDRNSEQTVLSFGEQMSFKDDRYSLQATEIGDNRQVFLLTIRNIQPHDSAVYECILVVGLSQKIIMHTELLVNAPAQVDLSAAVAEHSQPTRVGSKTTLQCKAFGYPRPTMHWMREDNALMPGGGTEYLGSALTIDPVHRNDRGAYWCVAQNGVGVADRKRLNFDVQFEPRIRTPSPRVAQALGYSIDLECVVEAYPPPTIEWFRLSADKVETELKRDSQLADQGYEIWTNAGDKEQTVSVLHVTDVQSKHFGEYGCRAKNVEGSASAVINLYKSILHVQAWKSRHRL